MEKPKKEKKEVERFTIKGPIDLQRVRLEKLMKDPVNNHYLYCRVVCLLLPVIAISITTISIQLSPLLHWFLYKIY